MAVGPAYSFSGSIDRMADAGRQAAQHPAATVSDQFAGTCLWALGECYRGDLDAARRILADHDELFARNDRAFVWFVRADIAAATDGDEALAHLDRGAQVARHDGDFLIARMIEVARLAALVRAGQSDAAIRLARTLLPELLAAGMIPQAWMALRHIAALLALLGEPAEAVWILDSAAASPHATELVGDAVDEEAVLRDRLEGSVASPAVRAPAAAGVLWAEVEATLARHAGV